MEKYYWWTEAQKKLADDARDIVDSIMPMEIEYGWTRHYPREIANELARYGWFGAQIPKKYGGRMEDWGITGACIMMEELGRCAATGSILSTTMIGGTHQIIHDGTEEQKMRWLPKIAKGELYCAICMTEPWAGSDVSSIETTAKRDGDVYILNGKKRFTTNLGGADLYMVYAKTSEAADDISKHRHLTGFIVEKGTAGFSVERMNELMGYDGAYNGYLSFDEARVPVDNMIGAEGEGWKVMMSGLNVERTLSAAAPLGALREAMKWAVYHLERRVQFGRRTIEQPVLQGKIADMVWHLSLGRLSLYYAAHQFDMGLDAPLEAAMLKMVCSDALMHDCIEAVQCMGGDGATKTYPVERLLRSAKIGQIAAGTSEIAKTVVFRQGLASYADDLRVPQRVIHEELGIPVPLGKERVRPVAPNLRGEERVVKVLAENYRVNPGLHMTREEMKVQMELGDEDLDTFISSLEEKGLAKTHRDRRGRIVLARPTFAALAEANPPEYYRYIPSWVTKEDMF